MANQSQDPKSQRIPISREDVSSILKTSESEIFRLETLDYYKVAWDDQMYPQYLSGLSLPQEEDPRWQEWFAALREDVSQGKSLSRVHLVPNVLTPYLRYEIEWGYKLYNEPSGENVFLAFKSSFPSTLLTQDFYLVDERQLVYIKYDADNSWVGFEMEDNPAFISAATQHKSDLLANATPLNDFLVKMRQASLVLKND